MLDPQNTPGMDLNDFVPCNSIGVAIGGVSGEIRCYNLVPTLLFHLCVIMMIVKMVYKGL